MGKYVNSLLTGDEHVVYETKLSWIVYVPYFTGIFACLVALAILWGIPDIPRYVSALAAGVFMAVLWLIPWIDRRCDEFVVTSRRVIMKTGVISRNVFEMRLGKVESVDLSQGVWGRLFNYGNVTIHGTGDTARHFRMISDPVRFRHKIDEAAENLRARGQS